MIYRLLKKSSNPQSKLVLQVSFWLSNTAFHLQLICLSTFGCDQLRIIPLMMMPEIVSKLLHADNGQQSEVAVLFCSNLSLNTRPFLGQVDNLDLLCTGFDFEHADLFLCPILTQRPMSEAMGAAFVSNNFFAISNFPPKISIEQ